MKKISHQRVTPDHGLPMGNVVMMPQRGTDPDSYGRGLVHGMLCGTAAWSLIAIAVELLKRM